CSRSSGRSSTAIRSGSAHPRPLRSTRADSRSSSSTPTYRCCRRNLLPRRRALRSERRPPSTPGSAFVRDSCSLPGFDCVLRTPLEQDSVAALVERVRRGGLEVLLDDDELAAVIEVDDVTGEHPRVDDVSDPAGGGVPVVTARAALERHADLLRPYGEDPPAAVQDVRRADEAGDERV